MSKSQKKWEKNRTALIFYDRICLALLKESWFGGTFGLLFGHRISLGVFVDLPVYYDKSLSTEIKGEGGEFFRQLTDAQPAIPQLVGFWTMVIMRW